jgi:hypothetical protein
MIGRLKSSTLELPADGKRAPDEMGSAWFSSQSEKSSEQSGGANQFDHDFI